jgi:hypothetical protein
MWWTGISDFGIRKMDGSSGLMTEEKGHSIVQLAKAAIVEYLTRGTILPVPETLTPEMSQAAGTFVSLKMNGNLRGCIGTFVPATSNVADEVIHNAISAATRDPRFSPVTLEEFKRVEVSVDVLTPPEPVSSLGELNPKRYGVIVQKGERRGLLLPDIDGVDTAERQIDIAMKKAGLTDEDLRDGNAELYRFEVKRYH